MKPEDIAWMSLNSIRRRKLRTWLTVASVVIGVVALTLLIGAGTGLQKEVKETLEVFGPKIVQVVPISSISAAAFYKPRVIRFTPQDLNAVRNMPGVEAATAAVSGRALIEYKGSEGQGFILGLEAENIERLVGNVEVKEGRLVEPGEKAVVVGEVFAENGFVNKKVELGSFLTVANRSYRVVGILKKTGAMASPVDSGIFMELDEARYALKKEKNEIDAIRAVVSDAYDTEEVAQNIKDRIASLHKLNDEEKDSFSVVTAKSIQSTVDSVLSMLTTFLGGLGLISVIVGTVGSMNTMYMSVIERTREIGILSSIGARKKEIVAMFMLESLIISLIGGLVGLGISFSIAFLASEYVPIEISLELVAGIMALCLASGVIAGYSPAMQAASVEPTVALRYE
ncbi:MAG: ABC transporter permease [Candidatus Anstonellales archaeon]